MAVVLRTCCPSSMKPGSYRAYIGISAGQCSTKWTFRRTPPDAPVSSTKIVQSARSGPLFWRRSQSCVPTVPHDSSNTTGNRSDRPATQGLDAAHVLQPDRGHLEVGLQLGETLFNERLTLVGM